MFFIILPRKKKADFGGLEAEIFRGKILQNAELPIRLKSTFY